MTCLLCHKLLVLHPQSHHTPTKPSEPHLGVCWSIGHFICSSLILSGKCLLCCKSNSRFTRLLITLPDDRPRLTHVWNRTCLCPLCIQIISSCDFPIWTLFFFKKPTLFGLHYHVASFRNLHLVVWVGFHLEEESNSRESASVFKYSLLCLHDVFILLHWTKCFFGWLLLKRGISAPFWEPSILPCALPCSHAGRWWLLVQLFSFDSELQIWSLQEPLRAHCHVMGSSSSVPAEFIASCWQKGGILLSLHAFHVILLPSQLSYCSLSSFFLLYAPERLLPFCPAGSCGAPFIAL